MTDATPSESRGFSQRLRERSNEQLEAFAEAEILSGLPSIFARDEEMALFQEYVAKALGISNAASDILIVGSAKTGFSLDPDNYFVPFRETSDIDIAVIHEGLFDRAWQTMLAWDYLTMKARTVPEQRWLYQRHDEVWSGWYDPPVWHLREQGGMQLSFPDSLKPLRDFSFRWFSTFRSLSRYRHHPEIPRHKASARLYRTRGHVAMYHAAGLRALRNRL
jgi:hypothetical protein